MVLLWIIFALVIGATTTIFVFYKKRFSYWKDRGVIYLEPRFPLGSLTYGKHFKDIATNAYNFKDQTPIIGAYTLWRAILVPTDLNLIQNILIKDFNNFHARGQYVNEEVDPLSAHMFALDGEKWKSIRSKLSPTFTSGKMKFMFPTVVEVAERFNETLTELVQKNMDMEIKDILGRFTTDVIGSCAFGIECNSLKDPNAAFRHYGKKVFDEPNLSILTQLVILINPDIGRMFKVRLFGKDVSDFFIKTVQDTIEYREKNNVRRNDFMDLLIQMKNDTSTKLSLEEIAAQAFVFFLAGFETSSTTMTFALYELALNPDVQERGRQEIEEVLARHDGRMTYEAVQEMVYIDYIISESLRKYPPLVFLVRKAADDYPVPNSKVIIKKGMEVLIPAYAIHHDSEIYPNPEVFDPERFTPENVKGRHSMSFLGFGDGPRNCVGLRFGRMQSRVGLITLLRNYRFEPCSKTQTPLKFDWKKGILSTEGGMFLKVEKM